MTELENELELLKSDTFRPKDWKKKISISTGYSENYIKEVFHGRRFNQTVALAIILLFASEKREILRQIEEAKQ